MANEREAGRRVANAHLTLHYDGIAGPSTPTRHVQEAETFLCSLETEPRRASDSKKEANQLGNQPQNIAALPCTWRTLHLYRLASDGELEFIRSYAERIHLSTRSLCGFALRLLSGTWSAEMCLSGGTRKEAPHASP